jgi:hypothetical protein
VALFRPSVVTFSLIPYVMNLIITIKKKFYDETPLHLSSENKRREDLILSIMTLNNSLIMEKFEYLKVHVFMASRTKNKHHTKHQFN